MKYQKLIAEINRCKSTAQSFLNYKRGDCTFDDFVMFAMENNNAPYNYTRDYFESLRNRTMEGSNSAIEGLMDYDVIFDVTLTEYIDNGEMEEEEADLIWSQGSRYFAIAKATLVA
tara:strand:+ start:3040 stop:3387 length:348 start_codon:yes stop_codon:yes gene_type:complete